VTAGFYVHPEHCGECGVSCVDLFENGMGTCGLVGGLPGCVLENCDDGFMMVGDNECAPVAEGFCVSCTSGEDCPNDLECITVGAGQFCLKACDTSADSCPQGFSCTQVDDSEWCLLSNGGCSVAGSPCSANAECEDLNACTDDLCPSDVCVHGTVNCGDGNDCTEDSCDAVQGCSNIDLADLTACEDGDGCTENDQCQSGSCTSGASVNCDDGIPCTDDSCVSTGASTSSCSNVVSESLCLVENQCVDAGAVSEQNTCLGCVPSTSSNSWVALSLGAVCDDGNPATNQDVCTEGSVCVGDEFACPTTTDCIPSYNQDGDGCTPEFAPESTGCDDGDVATKDDQCDSVGSCGGEAYTCSTPTTCTSYSQNGSDCVPNYGDTSVVCDDLDNTTKDDSCDGSGGCAGTAYSCPASTTCTTGYTQDGADCVANYASTSTVCNDQDNTTKDDSCDGNGACAGTSYSCPALEPPCIVGYNQDGIGCTLSLPSVQDLAQGVACDDQDNTTQIDQCTLDGTCAGTSYSCPTTTTCTPSYSQNGETCVSNYAGSSTACNDGNNATKNDFCNGAGQCIGAAYSCPAASTCTPSYSQNGSDCIPNYAGGSTSCNDGNNATSNDVCDGGGGCSGTPLNCPSPTTCIPSYTLDGSACVPGYAGGSTTCNDGNNGTNNDVCNGGGGCSGTPYSCPSPTNCISSYTQDGSGCVPGYAGGSTTCNDGNNGTNNDVCNGGGGCSGTPYSCPSPTICISSYTQDGSGCVPGYAGGSTSCNDGNNGTNNDVCNGGGGCSGTPYSCPSPPICILSYTQNGSGCAPNYAGGSTSCNDGNNGTNNDVCNGSGACSGTPYSCPSPTTCILGYTQNGSGCVVSYAGGSTSCNDGNNGTNNDVCNGSGACSGTPYSCPSPTTCIPSYTQNGSSCVPNYAGGSTSCNDGNNGTNNDTCNGGGDCQGTPYSCPAPSTCIPSYTQNGSTCIPNYPSGFTPCTDGNPCLTEDHCESGSCVPVKINSECTPGTSDTSAANCGTCQQATRSCSSSCTWGGFGSCTSYGECIDGSDEFGVGFEVVVCTPAFGGTGIKYRYCSGCSWGAWEFCDPIVIFP
jgi:hypothetical protein